MRPLLSISMLPWWGSGWPGANGRLPGWEKVWGTPGVPGKLARQVSRPCSQRSDFLTKCAAAQYLPPGFPALFSSIWRAGFLRLAAERFFPCRCSGSDRFQMETVYFTKLFTAWCQPARPEQAFKGWGTLLPIDCSRKCCSRWGGAGKSGIFLAPPKADKPTARLISKETL